MIDHFTYSLRKVKRISSILSQSNTNDIADPMTELEEVRMRESETITNPQRTTSKREVGREVGEAKIFRRTMPTPINAKIAV